MKKTHVTLLIILAATVLCACQNSAPPADTSGEACTNTSTAETEDTSAPETEEPNDTEIVFARRGERCSARVVFDVEGDPELHNSFTLIKNAISEITGVNIPPAYGDYREDMEYEIVLGSQKREDCAALTKELQPGEYAIKAIEKDGLKKVIIAYNGYFARECAVQKFINEFVSEDKVSVPGGTMIKEKCPNNAGAIILSTIEGLRDPCIIVEDGVYYAYGTGWKCYKNTSGDLAGKWTSLGVVARTPATAAADHWAPEVHKYKGEYYMFTTYRSSVTGHRGCTIMKSSSPEGPFVEITDGHITPKDWDSIDGTFYIDKDGQPWMVFVHEWTSTSDGVGRMAAAKLSDDLTHFISEPFELFRADDPSWTNNQVTDGCWMYTCENGELIMIWSNFLPGSGGYCVGIARSDNGRLDGKWSHDKTLLYSKTVAGVEYDGGHGMIFTDTDGQMYLSIHSPNTPTETRKTKPVFVPIKEENGTLVWDVED